MAAIKIVLKEFMASSIVKVSFVFLMFAGLLYFNHKVLSGSAVVDILFMLLVFIFLAAKKANDILKATEKNDKAKREEEIKYE